MMERVENPEVEIVRGEDVKMDRDAAVEWTRIMQEMSQRMIDRTISIGTSLEPLGLVVVTIEATGDLPAFTGAFHPEYARHTADIFELALARFSSNPLMAEIFPGIIEVLRSEASVAEREVGGTPATQH